MVVLLQAAWTGCWEGPACPGAGCVAQKCAVLVNLEICDLRLLYHVQVFNVSKLI